jgi:hypothetical protein
MLMMPSCPMSGGGVGGAGEHIKAEGKGRGEG